MTHPAITKSQEVYNSRDADDRLRDLEPHEETFLRAVSLIGKQHSTTVGEAIRSWGDGSRAYEATKYLADRQRDADLTAALEAYEAAVDASDEAMEIDFAQAAE